MKIKNLLLFVMLSAAAGAGVLSAGNDGEGILTDAAPADMSEGRIDFRNLPEEFGNYDAYFSTLFLKPKFFESVNGVAQLDAFLDSEDSRELREVYMYDCVCPRMLVLGTPGNRTFKLCLGERGFDNEASLFSLTGKRLKGVEVRVSGTSASSRNIFASLDNYHAAFFGACVENMDVSHVNLDGIEKAGLLYHALVQYLEGDYAKELRSLKIDLPLDADLRARLLNAVNQLPKLEKLTFTIEDPFLTPDALKALLRECPRLSGLDLYNMSVRPEYFSALAEHAAETGHCLELLSLNMFEPKEARPVIFDGFNQYVESGAAKELECLMLSNIEARSEDLDSLSGSFEQLSELRSFYLSNGSDEATTVEDSMNVMDALSGLSKLEEVHFMNLNIKGLRVAEGLSKITGLKKLYMVSNQVDDWTALVCVLRNCQNLEDVYVSGMPEEHANEIRNADSQPCVKVLY